MERLNNPRLAHAVHYEHTGVGLERAIQIACEATKTRYGWKQVDGDEANQPQLGILTLGINEYKNFEARWFFSQNQSLAADQDPQEWELNVSPPSVLYKAQKAGEAVPFPFIRLTAAGWTIEPRRQMGPSVTQRNRFSKLGHIFDIQSRLRGTDAGMYRRYIEEVLRSARLKGKIFGAVVLEVSLCVPA